LIIDNDNFRKPNNICHAALSIKKLYIFREIKIIFLLFFQDLKDYLRSAGDITYTNDHTPRQGKGIVEFASKRSLDYAMDHQDELELDSWRLHVSEERKGGSCSRSHSRSRSRSRSRTRSRSRLVLIIDNDNFCENPTLFATLHCLLKNFIFFEILKKKMLFFQDLKDYFNPVGW
jgi:hypothetical protein